MNDIAQILAGENIQKTCPYITFKSSNLKTCLTFNLESWIYVPCDNLSKNVSAFFRNQIVFEISTFIDYC